jgi:hypothetical protein
VDLFAGRHNRHTARYFSQKYESEAAATNAFSQNWALESNAYANPPFKAIPRVLQQVEAQGVELTLVAPLWGAAWWPQLARMCVEPPRLLPQAADLFLRVDGSPSPTPRWRTAAFRISGRQLYAPPLQLPLQMVPLSAARLPRHRRRR